MEVRDYCAGDMEFIRAWHERSGFKYRLPDFKDTRIESNKVVTEDGLPVAAACARATVEIYGFADQEWGTPGMRMAALKLLHAEIAKELKQANIRTAHAWIPPAIARAFGRRLKRIFGWYAPDPTWLCLAKDL